MILTIVDCGTDIGEEKDDYKQWAKFAETYNINRFSHRTLDMRDV